MYLSHVFKLKIKNNFRQGTLENDWTSTSELERNVASYTPTSPVPEMNL
jgi:hypothetical protein